MLTYSQKRCMKICFNGTVRHNKTYLRGVGVNVWASGGHVELFV